MSALEWTLQGVLLLLLLAALPFALRLERGLAALRQDRAALADGASGFETATREAQAALAGLRSALETQARQTATAESLREDLRFMLDRGEALADRLELLVRQGRPALGGAAAAAAPVAEEAAAPRSQAERDLLRALRMAR
ncbi:DUF6468 domain-containing protein [Muricoccus pecuniae]|uniref:ABC-type transporter Mla subunit MlaD n=1 Tax=Muricoccus pecuniae TaxID=693023 RepID=A0A840Y159_9PROT|nr:DUF6468 domain-containing protein [Roseomonas pecuniae]MBB5693320.1 ABC-type transporter Mla subunit MlaD [Roseomonas pecuniae]